MRDDGVGFRLEPDIGPEGDLLLVRLRVDLQVVEERGRVRAVGCVDVWMCVVVWWMSVSASS